MLYCIVCFSSTTFALAPIIIGLQLVELCVFLARPAIVVVVVVNYNDNNNNNDNYNNDDDNYNNDDDNYNDSNGIIMFKYVYLLATQLFISA